MAQSLLSAGGQAPLQIPLTYAAYRGLKPLQGRSRVELRRAMKDVGPLGAGLPSGTHRGRHQWPALELIKYLHQAIVGGCRCIVRLRRHQPEGVIVAARKMPNREELALKVFLLTRPFWRTPISTGLRGPFGLADRIREEALVAGSNGAGRESHSVDRPLVTTHPKAAQPAVAGLGINTPGRLASAPILIDCLRHGAGSGLEIADQAVP